MSEPNRSDDVVVHVRGSPDFDKAGLDDECLAYIDLTSISTNRFCPYCHNLSLYDHGPRTKNDNLDGYFSKLYTNFRERSFITRLYENTTIRDIVSVPNLICNWSCQYCRLILESTRILSPWPERLAPSEYCGYSVSLRPDRDAFIRPILPGITTLGFTVSSLSKRITDEVESGNSHSLPTNQRIVAESSAEVDYPFEDQGQLARGWPKFCSDETLDFLQNRLEACRRDHWGCQKKDNNFTPSRLIYLGACDAELRLIQMKKMRSEMDGKMQKGGVSYVALSHCWGSAEIIRLTSQNLMQFEERIPVESLPPVFRNAVAVARHCDIEYLWIDALNIIQDDIDDWAIESAMMASVFENAELVLAATRSVDGNASFFGPSAPYRREFIRFLLNGHDGRPIPMNVRRCSVRGLLRAEGPLVHRAWCLQEIYLSRRVVHFTDSEAWWQCQHECAKESASQPWEWTPAKLAYENVEPSWSNLVGDYSARKMTRPKDKLPAISGLASWHYENWKVQTKLESDEKIRRVKKDSLIYLAGLWLTDNSFAFQLSWRCRSGSRKHGVATFASKIFTAPSWSWASVAHPVAWIDRRKMLWQETDSEIRVVDWSCEPTTANPFGEVDQRSHIILRGRVIDLEIRAFDGHLLGIRKGEGMYERWTDNDCSLVAVQRGQEDGSKTFVARARSQDELSACGNSWAGLAKGLLLWKANQRFGSTCFMILGRPQQLTVENAWERLGIMIASKTFDNWYDNVGISEVKIV